MLPFLLFFLNKCIPECINTYPACVGQRKFFHEQPVSSRTVIWTRSDQTRIAQPSSRSDINTFASLLRILLGPVNRVQLLVYLEPSPTPTWRASKRDSIFNFAFPPCVCVCVCHCVSRRALTQLRKSRRISYISR